jgi:hypothetical protein
MVSFRSRGGTLMNKFGGKTNALAMSYSDFEWKQWKISSRNRSETFWSDPTRFRHLFYRIMSMLISAFFGNRKGIHLFDFKDSVDVDLQVYNAIEKTNGNLFSWISETIPRKLSPVSRFHGHLSHLLRISLPDDEILVRYSIPGSKLEIIPFIRRTYGCHGYQSTKATGG